MTCVVHCDVHLGPHRPYGCCSRGGRQCINDGSCAPSGQPLTGSTSATTAATPKVTAPAPTATTNYRQPEVFTGLSTENVKKKLREMSPGSSISDATIDAIAAGSLSPSEAPAVASHLVVLVQSASPSAFHVPAVDLLRACVSQNGSTSQAFLNNDGHQAYLVQRLLQDQPSAPLDNAARLISCASCPTCSLLGSRCVGPCLPTATITAFFGGHWHTTDSDTVLKVATYALLQNLILRAPPTNCRSDTGVVPQPESPGHEHSPRPAVGPRPMTSSCDC